MTDARNAACVLQVENLHIAFGGTPVVHDLSFSVHAGEKLALVGESGSGKSVTALALMGLAQAATVRGRALLASSNSDSDGVEMVDVLTCNAARLQGLRGRDIAMVFQEPMTAFNPVMTVGAQIMEVLQLKMGLTIAEAWKKAVQLLTDTGIDDPERRLKAYPHQLSGGQRQRAMIAMALACKPRVLLADEPTTALDVTVRRQILDLLDSLQTLYGMAIVLITHDLPLVRRFADRVAVMEQGRLVEQGSIHDVMQNPQHPYTVKLLKSGVSRNLSPVQSQAPTVLEARDVRIGYAVPRSGIRGWWSSGEFVAVHKASLALKAGETLGVIGESGSGKSTLAQALLGLIASTGNIEITGRTWSRSHASNLHLRRDIQVVFQDPYSSLSPRMTVGEIVAEGLLVHQSHMPPHERFTLAAQTLAEVGLSETQFPGLLHRYPHQFSGGQRQRIAIARALIVGPRILVLDEPTSALDVTLAQQILELLQSLQRQKGLSYVLITHDVEVIRAMAHRVMVMRAGHIVETGLQEEVLLAPQHEYTRILVAAAQ